VFFSNFLGLKQLSGKGKDSSSYVFNGNTKVGDEILIFEVFMDVSGFLLLF